MTGLSTGQHVRDMSWRGIFATFSAFVKQASQQPILVCSGQELVYNEGVFQGTRIKRACAMPDARCCGRLELERSGRTCEFN
jgi:hypothetical protein